MATPIDHSQLGVVKVLKIETVARGETFFHVLVYDARYNTVDERGQRTDKSSFEFWSSTNACVAPR